jgi:hypothetical protein
VAVAVLVMMAVQVMAELRQQAEATVVLEVLQTLQ